ncbi:hypothetical protein [Caulobacter sp. LARHSG274]
MNRSAAAVPATARTLSLNVHRVAVLALNTGFWTLIILVGRALYA